MSEPTNENPTPEEDEVHGFERVVPEEQYEEAVQVGGTVYNPPKGSLSEAEEAAVESGMPLGYDEDGNKVDEEDDEEK